MFKLGSGILSEAAGRRADVSRGITKRMADICYGCSLAMNTRNRCWCSRGIVNGELDASGCVACQRRSDLARGSEGLDGTGGNRVVNSRSEGWINVEGDEKEEEDEADDDEEDDVS